MPRLAMMHFWPNQNREPVWLPLPKRMIGAAIRSTEPRPAEAPDGNLLRGKPEPGHGL